MMPTGWQDWLNGWLRRHPLKEPPAELRRGYVQEVMARIRAGENPSPVFVWRPRLKPAWRLAFGGALATALAVAVVTTRSPHRDPALELWEELEEVEQLPEDTGPDSEEELLRDLQGLDEEELAFS